MVYSETHIDVIECKTGNWIQTINVKKCKPLNESGVLSLCVLNDQHHLVYLSNKNENNLINLNHVIGYDSNERFIQKPKRWFSLREPNKSQKTERRPKMISAPTNFNHIAHVGPGEGIQKQKLIDLPTSLESLDSSKEMQSIMSKTSISSIKHADKILHNGNNSTNLKRAYIQRPKELPPTLPKFHEKKSIPIEKNNLSFENSYSTESTLSLNDSVYGQQLHQPPLSHLQQQPHPNLNLTKSSASPRHSVISNNSSNVSSPPSPIQHEIGHNYSSSYDS